VPYNEADQTNSGIIIFCFLYRHVILFYTKGRDEVVYGAVLRGILGN